MSLSLRLTLKYINQKINQQLKQEPEIWLIKKSVAFSAILGISLLA